MSIKLDRACKLARMLPSAEAEILSSMRPELIERLTARELAMVMCCLDTHWHKARAFEANNILSEGCIWDPGIGKLRELGAPWEPAPPEPPVPPPPAGWLRLF